MAEKTFEEITLKELQDQLSERGIENANIFTTKKQAWTVLEELKNRDKMTELDIKISEEDKQKDKQTHRSKALRMKEILSKQEKVQVYLPLEGKEVKGEIREIIDKNGNKKQVIDGAYETVILNGWVTYIPKGVPWKVPEQVADILGQSQAQTVDAGKEFLMDRQKEVQDALT